MALQITQTVCVTVIILAVLFLILVFSMRPRE